MPRGRGRGPGRGPRHRQHGAGGLAEYGGGDGAQNEAGDRGPSVRSHDDDVGSGRERVRPVLCDLDGARADGDAVGE